MVILLPHGNAGGKRSGVVFGNFIRWRFFALIGGMPAPVLDCDGHFAPRKNCSFDRAFPADRKLGPDIILIIIFAASVNTYDEGLPVTANKIAHFLELPRETTRRHLQTLVRLGLLTRRDRNYSPTEWAVHNYTNKAADLVKETAAML
jgi:hypothetical protein